MSLNCKQLKQKYEELLSEKDSFVLEYERFKNGGDDKKVKELKVRLEKNTKEMREVLMFPGSLFLGIKKLVENNNINIEGIINVKVSFDGKLRGVIQSDSKILLFCDDEIMDSVDGVKIREVGPICVLPNNTMAGVVEIGENDYRLFKGNELLDRLNITGYSNFKNVFSMKDGTLVGKVNIEASGRLFKENNIIEKIGGETIVDVDQFCLTSNDVFAGIVKINEDYGNPSGGEYPFLGETIFKQFEGKDVERVAGAHIRPDGKFSGLVKIGGVWKVFCEDKIIRDFPLSSILHRRFTPECIHTQPNGNIAGKILVGEIWFPFEESNVITQIAGEDIKETVFVFTNSDGKLVYSCKTDSKGYFFDGRDVVSEISGVNIPKSFSAYLEFDNSVVGDVHPDRNEPFDYGCFIFDGEKYVFLDEINKKD